MNQYDLFQNDQFGNSNRDLKQSLKKKTRPYSLTPSDKLSQINFRNPNKKLKFPRMEMNDKEDRNVGVDLVRGDPNILRRADKVGQ